MKKISYFFLFTLVFLGCGDEPSSEDEVVKHLVEDELVFDTEPGKKITWETDGKEMVLIPAGSFEMGDHFSEGEENELPVHRVNLDGFYIDTHEVTVDQFKQFVNQSGYDYQGDWGQVALYSPGHDYPINYVNWNDATAYAEWSGKRLPTEAEWEYAARGSLERKRYPWGDEIDNAKAHYDNWNDGNGTTKLVGSFEANGYGLYDMAGNAWEWCQDWYGENYYSSSPASDPTGPETGSMRVLRGGSWAHVTPDGLRAAYRFNSLPSIRHPLIGFRCVLDVP